MPDAPLPDVEILRREAERLAARADAAWVQRMELNGQVFWLKIVKERGALLRLRKSSARTLLAREAETVSTLSARGLPVPRLLLYTVSCIVLDDAGTPLDQHLRPILKPGPDLAPDPAPLLAQAARALADLHCAGGAHGSPHLRNMCLNPNGEITFIDLEGATPENAPLAARAYDLRLLVFSPRAHLSPIWRGPRHAHSPAPALKATLHWKRWPAAPISGLTIKGRRPWGWETLPTI